MSIVLKNANILIGRTLALGDLLIQGELIGAVGEGLCGDKAFDLAGKTVLPGFIDTHTHGGGGYDVNLSTREDLTKLSDFFAAQGTTLWLASVLTDTREKTLECISNITQAMADKSGAKLYGIHLEGPFLSEEYKGAMPPWLLQSGDLALFREYQAAANGAIKYMTVAPEVDGVLPLIQQISSEINVGIGHSNADFDTAMAAIEAGACLSTHTFNAMRPLHHHEIGIAGAALLSDIWCEAIGDGLHLSPATLNLILKTKGYDRVVVITDSIMAAGLADGDYKLGVNDVVVKGGDARLKVGDARAGSTLTMGRAIKNLVRFTGKPVEEIACLVTENPAKELGIFGSRGSIAPGKFADLAVLSEDLDVVMTIREGRIVFQK
ncbi:MAG: N-acetylglucosamine-6-phosphate deacetylase [Oscillospiraceae bacterium]